MHIAVCVCTYKRPEWLRQLLLRLIGLDRSDAFTYSLVVVDNDRERSAEAVVAEVREGSRLDIRYVVEPMKNISRARNKAVRASEGELIVFIDDDEYPGHERWLIDLYNAFKEFRADAVIGPLAPHYLFKPSLWMEKGGFFSYRKEFETGRPLAWHECATSNTLLSREIFRRGILFDEAFGSTGGEDSKLFWDAAAAGYRFIACRTALVYERVPEHRGTLFWILARAFRTGGIFAFIAMENRSWVRRFWLFSLVLCRTLAAVLTLPVSALRGRDVAARTAVQAAANAGQAWGVCGRLVEGY